MKKPFIITIGIIALAAIIGGLWLPWNVSAADLDTAGWKVVFNLNGTHFKNGSLLVRLDLIPPEGTEAYKVHHVNVIDETSEDWLSGYPGKVNEFGEPIDQEDYDAWINSLPRIWRTNPALSHFIVVPREIDSTYLENWIASYLNADYFATLDGIYALEVAGQLIKDRADYISPLMKSIITGETEKTASALESYYIDQVNTRLSDFSVSTDTNTGTAKEITPESIDVGPGATDRSDDVSIGGRVEMPLDNPANADGSLDTIEMFARSNCADVVFYTMYLDSGTDYIIRDSHNIGSVTSGSKQTFTSSVDVDVVTGDYAAAHKSSGSWEYDKSGAGGVRYSGSISAPSPTDTVTMSGNWSDYVFSIYATGTESSAEDEGPTVISIAASSIEETTATASGNITSVGSENVTMRGIQYDTDSGAPYSGNSTESGNFTTGAFNRSLSGLTKGELYYFRAVAENSVNQSYGDELTFLTKPDPATGFTVDSYGDTWIQVSWTPSTGDDIYGIRWDTSAVSDNTSGSSGYWGDSTSANITGLPTGTTVHFRVDAYATEGGLISQADGDVQTSQETIPAAPTNVSATDGAHNDKVVVTWTKSTGATGYLIYRDDVLIDTLGDVATYDDTGADAGTITPGTAAASDGTSSEHVTLSITGESTSNGTSHTYYVKATSGAGTSDASGSDTGYRGVGGISYQWQRSSGDADSDYSNLVGATTDPYNDTTAPEGEVGRYYKCTLSADGADNVTTNADRGYRAAGVSTPSVTTNDATNVEETTATLNGNLTNAGGENCTLTFHWGTTSGVYSANYTLAGTHGTGAFSYNATGLTEGEAYYFIASANNTAGTANGTEKKFLTKPVGPVTGFASGGTGNITLEWNTYPSSDKTYVYAKQGDYPSALGDGTLIYSGTDNTTIHSGLGDNETWYYRAWAYCSEDGMEKYSDSYTQMTATTDTQLPSITTLDATGVTDDSAQLNGNLTDDGGVTCNITWFWGESDEGETEAWSFNTTQNDKTTGAQSYSISDNLTPETLYFFTVRAVNTEGTTWGSTVNFTTTATPPVVITYTADGFTVSGSKLTHTGDYTRVFKVDASLTVSTNSTANITVSAAIYHNGAVVTRSIQSATVADSFNVEITLNCLIEMSKDDYLEIYISPDSACTVHVERLNITAVSV